MTKHLDQELCYGSEFRCSELKAQCQSHARWNFTHCRPGGLRGNWVASQLLALANCPLLIPLGDNRCMLLQPQLSSIHRVWKGGWPSLRSAEVSVTVKK